MANQRLDQLPESNNSLLGTDIIPIFSDGRTERTTIDELATYIDAGNDSFVTGATLNVNTLEISRNQGLSTLSVNLSGLTPTPPFTGNTSGSCITDLYVSNLYGCSPLTLHDGLQSSLGSVGNDRSIAWGNDVTVVGTNQPEISKMVISGITIGYHDEFGDTAVLLPDDDESVADEWLNYLSFGGGSVTLTLYGGSDPVETYVIDYVAWDFDVTTGLWDDTIPQTPTGTTHTTLSATVVTQTFIDENSYAFGKDITIDGNYSMLVGSGMTTTDDYVYRFGRNIRESTGSRESFSLTVGDNVNTFSTDFSFTMGQSLNNSGDNSHISGIGVGVTLSNSGTGAFMHHVANETSKGNRGDYSVLIGGLNHKIENRADYSSIIAGEKNLIDSDALRNTILGGRYNIINSDVLNSTILGGEYITGATNNTVYVPNFVISTSYTPSSSGDTVGDIGSVTWDNTYVYTKTNTGWGRTPLDYSF